MLLAAFERQNPDPSAVKAIEQLIDERCLFMVGWVRQGLLTRTADDRQFHRLSRALAPFPDINIQSGDHMQAAALTRDLRHRGIPIQPAQALMWCMAERVGARILTRDKRWWALERYGAPLRRL